MQFGMAKAVTEEDLFDSSHLELADPIIQGLYSEWNTYLSIITYSCYTKTL